MFDGLKARLERLFAEAEQRDDGGSLRDAVVEMRAAVAALRDALAQSERELDAERRQLADATRRRDLARDIEDMETVDVAERFATRHTERVAVLERKLGVQRDELALAERELSEVMGRFRIQQGRAGGGAPASIDRAWRDIAAAGGTRPELDLEGELAKAEADRKLHEAAVEAQLAHLKRKLGRDSQ